MKKLVPFALAILFVFSTTSYAAGPKRHKVTLQLKWMHQFQFAGYYAAQEMVTLMKSASTLRSSPAVRKST